MRQVPVYLCLFSLLLFYSCSSLSQGPDSQTTVKAAITKTIYLLKYKKYKQLFNEIVHPQDIIKFKEKGFSISDMAYQFGIEGADSFYSVLLYIQDKKADYQDRGSRAVFDLTPMKNSDLNFTKMVFERHKDKWFIRN